MENIDKARPSFYDGSGKVEFSKEIAPNQEKEEEFDMNKHRHLLSGNPYSDQPTPK